MFQLHKSITKHKILIIQNLKKKKKQIAGSEFLANDGEIATTHHCQASRRRVIFLFLFGLLFQRAWRVARTPAFVAPVSLEYLFSSFELSSCCESLSLRCMDSSVSAASYLPLPVFYR